MGRPRVIKLAAIKKSMLEQLRKNDCETDFYSSLVDKYIFAEEQIRAMEDDIKVNGLSITAISAQGKQYDKDNPAIKTRDMYVKQQLSIIKQLGLNIETIDAGAEDDSDSDL